MKREMAQHLKRKNVFVIRAIPVTDPDASWRCSGGHHVGGGEVV